MDSVSAQLQESGYAVIPDMVRIDEIDRPGPGSSSSHQIAGRMDPDQCASDGCRSLGLHRTAFDGGGGARAGLTAALQFDYAL